MMFWVLLGAGFVLTGLVGVLVMWRTEHVLISFAAGTLVNTLIAVGSIWWWSSVFPGEEHHFNRMFGIFGYVVSAVNNAVLLLFAQLAMKKKIGGASSAQEQLQYDDDL